MRIQVISPFKDGRPLWLGLMEEGMRRKVYRLIDKHSGNAKQLCAGLTIFEPGERCPVHNHPNSEELNLVIRGSGHLVSEGTTRRLSPMDVAFIPPGVEHQHVNDGDEPLWLFFVYSPQAELPAR